MKPKLRGVCIGAGYFSHFQYEAWQRIPEVEIVAISSRHPEKAEKLVAEVGGKALTDDRAILT